MEFLSGDYFFDHRRGFGIDGKVWGEFYRAQFVRCPSIVPFFAHVNKLIKVDAVIDLAKRILSHKSADYLHASVECNFQRLEKYRRRPACPVPKLGTDSPQSRLESLLHMWGRLKTHDPSELSSLPRSNGWKPTQARP